MREAQRGRKIQLREDIRRGKEKHKWGIGLREEERKR